MWQHFKDWYASPFRADMSATGWFAFLTLLIVIAAMQGFILQHIRGK